MIFKVEVSVTDQCNLRCTYCYNHFENNYLNKDKFDEFYQNLTNLMFQAHCEKYSISLFGGEPLLNWKLCQYIIEKCHNDIYCDSIVIVSNLLLINKKIVDYIHNFKKVGVSWSFDGIYNDVQRPQHNNLNNIHKYIIKKDLILSLTTTCKVMVAPNSLNFVKNAEFLKTFGIKAIDFTPVYDDIWNNDDVLKFENNLNLLNIWYKNNQDINVSFYSDLQKQIKNSKTFVRNYPCFAGINGLCLSAKGDLYPCQRFAVNNKYKISDFKSHLNNFKQLVDRTNECKNCEIYSICPVGCTYSILGNKGLIKNICKLHKIIYNNALKIINKKRN